MQTDSFRFEPPSVEIPAGVRWSLGRAFAEPGWAAPRDVRPEAALSWAATLSVEARIAFRSSPEQVARELREESSRQLFRARHQAVADGMLLQDLLETVAVCGAELDVPLVALRGVALLESGVTAPGSRSFGDLHLLVPVGQAKRLARRLLDEGMQPSARAESTHHLPPLSHPTLGTLRIYRQLQGLSVHGSGDATAEDLIRCGLCRQSPRLGGVQLPLDSIMAAHALAHSLDHHAHTPRICPPTKMLGDLYDLAADEGEEVEPFILGCGRYIRRCVSKRELQAVSDLCHHLAAGSPAAYSGDSGALIRHVVAASRDTKYQRSLRRAAWLDALASRDWKKLKGGR